MITDIYLKNGQCVTITNTYRHTKSNKKEEIQQYGQELLEQVNQNNHFILGDINAQSEEWGPRDNPEGKILNQHFHDE